MSFFLWSADSQERLLRGFVLCPSACLSSRVAHSSGSWGKERSLMKVWSSHISVQIVQWGQTVQPIFYKIKNGNFKGLCLALSQINSGVIRGFYWVGQKVSSGFSVTSYI